MPAALYSSSISQKFYEIAYDLANSDDTTYIENELAISFLISAMNLNENNSDVHSLLLKCICRFPERRALTMDAQGQTNFNLVYTLLRQYINENTDFELASEAVSFLINQAGSSVQKQTLLEQMIRIFENKNSALNSQLLTNLGMLKLQNNLSEEAEKSFRQAYQANKYNKIAFSKLYELSSSRISPVEYLERLRLDLRENPIDLRAVLAFCQSLEQFQLYDLAAMAYEYSSDVFKYLYPSDALPVEIYIPWSISCYNSNKYQIKCLEIAESVRKTGKFDIRIESLAGRAASKLGQDNLALKIISNAESKALELLNEKSLEITDAQLAWFYSFVLPMPDKAMEWANRAFAANSNSPLETSLLVYSLTQKKEFSTAKSIINQFPHTQISELAIAQIQLEEGLGDQGIENLNKSISRDPGSFEAEHAKDILAKNGEKYIPPVNADFIQASITNLFGSKLVPDFTKPEKMFSFAFNIRKKEFSFGGDLDSAFSITNNSSEPLVINDDSMFKGYIRIDAIVNGDMSKRIPNLVSKRIESNGVIEPGKSKIVNIKLITGELREMLLTYPQASMNITFVLYIDPVNIDERVNNRLASINPVSVTVTRPGVIISGQGIRNLVNSVSTSKTGQKIQSSQLFISLLKEQEALSGRTSPYHTYFSDGMKTLLKSALIYDSGLLKNPENGGWVVKVFTMAEMMSLHLDYELVEAVSENLYNSNWPVRMMAVYLLAENQEEKFVKVLESISKNDKNQLIKDVAAAEIMKVRFKN
ncbi:MAG: hypothetical protein JXA96_01910 [Sedimentisphaerales bacterium]|nr:hypothetical protein [Sedimentisphaerales bacterium]